MELALQILNYLASDERVVYDIHDICNKFNLDKTTVTKEIMSLWRGHFILCDASFYSGELYVKCVTESGLEYLNSLSEV